MQKTQNAVEKCKKNIKIYLAENELTQSKIAKILGMDSSTLSEKLNNKRTLTLPEVLKIMDLLGKNFDDIFLK